MPRFATALMVIGCCAMAPPLSPALARPVAPPAASCAPAPDAPFAAVQPPAAAPQGDWPLLACGLAIAVAIARRRADAPVTLAPPGDSGGPAARFTLLPGPAAMAERV